LQVYPLDGTLASPVRREFKGEFEVQENDDLPQNMPKPKRDLDPISIEELHEYIAEMEEEIMRVRGEIAKKEAHKAGVDALFRK